MKSNFYILGLLIIFVISGCKKNTTITGTVVLKEDSKPLSSGRIIFENEKILGQTSLEKDGSYKIDIPIVSTSDEYYNFKVYFANISPDKKNLFSSSLIAPKYSSPQTTDLECEVKVKGKNNFDFSLEKNTMKSKQRNLGPVSSKHKWGGLE